MDLSGTLHFYSGDDRELFFVFDDVVAQGMYDESRFKIDDLESRRVYISVGNDQFIHRRTLSFSRKQVEIKVSLCSRNTKDGLGSLTDLYDWFASRGVGPAPFGVLGRLAKARHEGDSVWELTLTEPEDLITPPGFTRRLKKVSRERKSFEHRREIQQRKTTVPGRRAEKLALNILSQEFTEPNYRCLWRNQFLDSEQIEVRKMGIIADIDVWDVTANTPEQFVEVKAQKVVGIKAKPKFHLSSGEWRSYLSAKERGIPYVIWLFQYRDLEDLKSAPQNVTLILFNEVVEDWLEPDGYLVAPPSAAGERRKLRKVHKPR